MGGGRGLTFRRSGGGWCTSLDGPNPSPFLTTITVAGICLAAVTRFGSTPKSDPAGAHGRNACSVTMLVSTGENGLAIAKAGLGGFAVSLSLRRELEPDVRRDVGLCVARGLRFAPHVERPYSAVCVGSATRRRPIRGRRPRSRRMNPTLWNRTTKRPSTARPMEGGPREVPRLLNCSHAPEIAPTSVRIKIQGVSPKPVAYAP